MKTEKPWGYEILHCHTDRIAAKTLFMKEGFCCSLQLHSAKFEILFIQSGKMKLTVGLDVNELKEIILTPGDVYVLPPNTIHRCEAIDGDLLYFESSTPELTDITRFSDLYGRT